MFSKKFKLKQNSKLGKLGQNRVFVLILRGRRGENFPYLGGSRLFQVILVGVYAENPGGAGTLRPKAA